MFSLKVTGGGEKSWDLDGKGLTVRQKYLPLDSHTLYLTAWLLDWKTYCYAVRLQIWLINSQIAKLTEILFS